MRFFTNFFVAAILAAASLTSALAATITVTVGDNTYQGPNGTSSITMSVGDVLEFRYAGSSSHPTASSSTPQAWATFQMNAGNRLKTFAANTFMPGVYPFFCTAHFGQTGTLTVVAQATAATSANILAPVLTVFPNPSHGQVTVQLDQKAGQTYKLRLSNIIGKEIRTVALKPELSETKVALDLSDLPTGLYFYSLLVNDKVVSTKRLTLQN